MTPKAKAQEALRKVAKKTLKKAVVKKAAPAPAKKAAAKPPAPAPKPPEPVQAREETGRFAADNPETPEVNEAFEGGKPLKPKFDSKMKKVDLLGVAKELGIGGLSMDNTKAEILAALEEA
jgi:hypothetical protein